MSSDFASSLWFASVPGQSSADVYLDLPDDTVKFMGPGGPPGATELALNFMGASKNLANALFIARSANGGLEEEHLWPGDTTLGERRTSLYEYAGVGRSEPSLVGVSDDHEVAHINESHLISNCGTVLGSGPNPRGDAYNAISSDGETVFFTAKGCGGSPPTDELYARLNRNKTVAISEPALSVPGRDCEGACAVAQNMPGNRRAGVFAGASLDGSTVLFMTSQPLLNADADGGVDLYEADLSEGAVARLMQVSRGGEGDLTPGSGATVLGVARVSEDGSHVYFVAEGVLSGANREGNKPADGEPNLYVVTKICPEGGISCTNPAERTSFIATLAVNDSSDWSPVDRRPVQATPDGRFLVFESTGDLTTDQGEQLEAGQVFEYDAQVEKLVRVSRGQNGYNNDGNSSTHRAAIVSQNYTVDSPSVRSSHLAVSDDGSRVVFSTEDALVPQALEGIRNVYESHEGKTSLISDGYDVQTVNEESATELIGIDESGHDVFFTTTDRLVPQDTDTQVDVYDARLGGGFPPPSELARCAADSCQGPGSLTPVVLISTSTTVTPEASNAPSFSHILSKPNPHKKKAKAHKKKAEKHKSKRMIRKKR